jgi:hypothetical protein
MKTGWALQKRKEIALAALIGGALMSGVAAAAEADDEDFDGYSYASLGVEHITYQEHLTLAPVVSKAVANNIAMRTGGLFRITPKLDFSLDTGTTLLQDIVREQWRAAPGSAFQQALPDQSTNVVQSDDFTFSSSTVLALAHWKHSNEFRSVYGVNYDSSSFKRYNYATTQSPLIGLPSGAVEETSTHVSLATGLDFESAGLARERSRAQLRALVFLPVWQQTTNTDVPNSTFTETEGLAASISGSWSWRFYRGLEVGATASYGWRKQNREKQVDAAGTHELPKNELTNAYMGLQLGWNLSRKD